MREKTPCLRPWRQGAFCLLELLDVPGRAAEPPVHIEGEQNGQAVCHGLGPDQPIHAHKGVQQKQHGDVQHQPPGHAQEQGDAPLAEGLEEIDGEKAQEHQRRGQHPDAQKLRGQLHGAGIRDEQVRKLHGEQPIQQDAHRSHREAGATGQPHSALHAAAVAGGVVVGHQRHHALADADAHVQREAFHLQHDAHRRQRQIVVGHHQLVNDDIVQVKEEGGDGRGHPNTENGGNALRPGHARFGGEGDGGATPHPHQDHRKEEEGHAVGKAGGKPRAQHLLPVRQKDEHEQRVQGDVQNAAQNDAGAGLAGEADASYQVGKHVGKHRGHAADNDDAQGVLSGVFIGVCPCAQQLQHRLHEHKNTHGKQRRHCQPKIQREGAHPAGLLLVAFAQQSGDQRAAADARKACQTQGDVEHRQNEGGSRHHVGVVGLAHKKGVGHVVDQHDQLAGHRRKHHFGQRGMDGEGAENVLPG